jgi:outer membrane protein OmpA-like peptidoglycan-associated protein
MHRIPIEDPTAGRSARGGPRVWIGWCGVLCTLAACTSTPVAPDLRKAPRAGTQAASSPPAPAPAANGPAYAPGLAAEQHWLDTWFRGTPVVIAQNDAGELIVEVPRAYCFEIGNSRLRPALAAVLDKVAQTLRRSPAARLVALAAPDDKPGRSPLALQRATRLHQRLLERGVTAGQLAAPSATLASAVQLRIGLTERR